MYVVQCMCTNQRSLRMPSRQRPHRGRQAQPGPNTLFKGEGG